MKIFIISCPHLSEQRLPSLIKGLVPSLETGLIENIELIVGSDEIIAKKAKEFYEPSSWSKHILLAWPAFYRNIIGVQLKSSKINKSISDLITNDINHIDPLLVFPQRNLTPIEISITNRHFLAWKLASHYEGRSLILEDDAIPVNSYQLNQLLLFLNQNFIQDQFIDLADDYIPPVLSKVKDLKQFKDIIYTFRERAIVRTLMAYSITNKLAQSILEFHSGYSLPVDMHLQYLLTSIKASGLTITSPVFTHESKSGKYNSSTESR